MSPKLRPCSYPPTPVEHTVDAQGYVLVDGRRVPHTAAGDHLRWTPSCTTACAQCHRHNVAQLMHVVAVLDDVVPGGVQYYTAIKDMRRLCDECGELAGRVEYHGTWVPASASASAPASASASVSGVGPGRRVGQTRRRG